MRYARLSVGALALFALLISGCGDGVIVEPAPEAGFMEVYLSGARPQLGAILFTVTGPGIDSLNSASHTLFEGSPSSGTRPVIAVGPLSLGVVLRFWVPDVEGSYSCLLLEAAERETYRQHDVQDYTLAVRRQ